MSAPEINRWMEHRRGAPPVDETPFAEHGVPVIPATGLPPATRSALSPRSRGAMVKYEPDQWALMKANVAALYVKKLTVLAISQQLNIGRNTVQKIRKELEAEWIARSGVSFDLHKARELNEIDRLQAKYEEAYEKSCAKRSKQHVEYDYIDAKGGPATAVDTETDRRRRPRSQKVQVEEGPEGDPRFLDGVLRCIDRRIRLLGLDEPEKYNVGVGVGNANNQRTAAEERFNTALALVGVAVVHDVRSASPSGDPDGDDFGESLDSGDAYIEASGVPYP